METRTIKLDLNKDPTLKRIESDYYVEGLATTFSPYVLMKDGNDTVYEQIHPEAFRNAKMNDVIMQFDHSGRIFARQSNGTLGLEVTDAGLLIWADLSKTEAARALYDDIRSGMVSKMSWAFRVAPGGRRYDPATHTIHVNAVSEVVDVSAVSRPANDGTTISARKLIDAEAKKREFLKLKIEMERG